MNWKQRLNKLILEWSEQETYWIMPPGYSLENTSPALLRLAETILFYPWDKSTADFSERREVGSYHSLSLSTGVDSVAAMLLMPKDTYLAYHKRDFSSQLIHDNADRFIQACDRNILVVHSNHEKIRTNWNLNIGFSTDFACCVHLVLLADYLDLKSISVGTILESAYMARQVENGEVINYKFRDFKETDYYKTWSKLFLHAGLQLTFPTIGLSEVLTNKLVQNSAYKELAQSCLRKLGGCNRCYKCYRKNLLNGNQLQMNSETEKFVKPPPKMGAPLIWAMNKWGFQIKGLDRYKDLDLNFLEYYYRDYLDTIMDKELRTHVECCLHESDISYMDDNNTMKFKKFNLNNLSRLPTVDPCKIAKQPKSKNTNPKRLISKIIYIYKERRFVTSLYFHINKITLKLKGLMGFRQNH